MRFSYQRTEIKPTCNRTVRCTKVMHLHYWNSLSCQDCARSKLKMLKIPWPAQNSIYGHGPVNMLFLFSFIRWIKINWISCSLVMQSIRCWGIRNHNLSLDIKHSFHAFPNQEGKSSSLKHSLVYINGKSLRLYFTVDGYQHAIT